jgi:hypothetical protein
MQSTPQACRQVCFLFFKPLKVKKNLYVVDFFLPTTIYSGFEPSINRANFLGFAAKFTSKNPEKC